jgi:hypothetical protein
MDYQQDQNLKVPWAKIIVINIVVTIIVTFLFNAAIDFVLPTGAISRIKNLEKNTAEMQVSFEKIFGKIKIGN